MATLDQAQLAALLKGLEKVGKTAAKKVDLSDVAERIHGTDTGRGVPASQTLETTLPVSTPDASAPAQPEPRPDVASGVQEPVVAASPTPTAALETPPARLPRARRPRTAEPTPAPTPSPSVAPALDAPRRAGRPRGVATDEGGAGQPPEGNGDTQRANEEVNYASVNRGEIEQWIRSRENPWVRVNEVSKSLHALANICGEISDLRGWERLVTSVNSLPGHELTDKVIRKKKYEWVDEQKAALGDEKRQSEVAAPEEWATLYLQLHDLLVASQGVLFELRAQVADRGVPGRADDEGALAGVPERKKRLTVPEKFERANVLLVQWNRVARELGRDRLLATIKEKRQGHDILDVKKARDWFKSLENKSEDYWNDEKEGRGRKGILTKRLGSLERLLEDAEAIAPELRAEGRQERSRTPKSIEELETLVIPTQMRIRQGVAAWDVLWGTIDPDKQKPFQEDLAKRLGLVGVPRIKELAYEFIEGQTEHHWKGEEARKDIERMLRFADTLDGIVSAGQATLAEMGVKPAAASVPVAASGDRRRPSPEESFNRLPSLEAKIEALGKRLDYWDRMVMETVAMGGEDRLERAIVEVLNGKGRDKTTGQQYHTSVRQWLETVRLDDARRPKNLEKYLLNNYLTYEEFISRGKQLRDELRAAQSALVSAMPAPAATPAAAPAMPDAGMPTSPTAPAVPDEPGAPAAMPTQRTLGVPEGFDIEASRRLGTLLDICESFQWKYSGATESIDSMQDGAQQEVLRQALKGVYVDFVGMNDPALLRRYALGEMEVAGIRQRGDAPVEQGGSMDGYELQADRLEALLKQVEHIWSEARLAKAAKDDPDRAIEEVEFQEKLGRAQDLVDMGVKLRQWFGTKWDKTVIPLLRERVQVHQLRSLSLFAIQDWLAKREEKHHWQGQEATEDRRHLVEKMLPSLEMLVAAMEDIARDLHQTGKIKKDIPGHDVSRAAQAGTFPDYTKVKLPAAAEAAPVGAAAAAAAKAEGAPKKELTDTEVEQLGMEIYTSMQALLQTFHTELKKRGLTKKKDRDAEVAKHYPRQVERALAKISAVIELNPAARTAIEEVLYDLPGKVK